ncbi:hypothetical protein [Sphingobium yanoikuyae]|uniref:hypothetical protein n=1 Tax=Sphingobium yanoikuyae TaxID=13690 RepID=UPI002FDDB54E
MTNTQSEIALAGVHAALADPTSDFLAVGAALRRLQDVDAATYKDLLKAGKVGSRQAYYWVGIDRAFEGLGVSEERLRAIGWTKLKELSGHISKVNAKELLQLAEKHTAKDLERVLGGEESMEGARAVNLRFEPGDYALVRAALIQFGAIPAGRGLEGKEEALVAIVKEVLAKA